jgi:hypothetical protein
VASPTPPHTPDRLALMGCLFAILVLLFGIGVAIPAA